MRPRKHITLKTKLAAALCHMLRVDDAGRLVRIISHEESMRLSEDEVIARFHFDHDPIPHAEDGPDEHWNLPPRIRAEHGEKTKADISRIAKNKRVARSHAEHLANMAGKAGMVSDKPHRVRKIGRKIRSRSSFPAGRKFQSRRSA